MSAESADKADQSSEKRRIDTLSGKNIKIHQKSDIYAKTEKGKKVKLIYFI